MTRAPADVEFALYRAGFRAVAGVDEAGRGALAGPVVAAAVILPEPWDWVPECPVIDSKLLTPGERERAFGVITACARAWGVGQAEVNEIEELGIGRASLLAMVRAVEGLKVAPDCVLVDGPWSLGIGLPEVSLVQGEQRSVSVAAASIIAKVTRDRLMACLDRKYPGYDFARHKGYPTAEHLRRLAELGPSPAHRRRFRPVAEVLTRDVPDG
ncbi:MAG: ribonuclease HII [Chloroflexota bacterium]